MTLKNQILVTPSGNWEPITIVHTNNYNKTLFPPCLCQPDSESHSPATGRPTKAGLVQCTKEQGDLGNIKRILMDPGWREKKSHCVVNFRQRLITDTSAGLTGNENDDPAICVVQGAMTRMGGERKWGKSCRKVETRVMTRLSNTFVCFSDVRKPLIQTILYLQ